MGKIDVFISYDFITRTDAHPSARREISTCVVRGLCLHFLSIMCCFKRIVLRWLLLNLTQKLTVCFVECLRVHFSLWFSKLM